jgi:predicted ATPase
LVTLLAKALRKDSKIICIDEPEIHLHPSVISKLVGVLVEIANKESKQFIISTHSEHFITALLKHIKNQDFKAEDAKVYYLKKEGQKTIIENQPINEKGQIEGGLVHFYETELEDLSALFNITE